MDSPHSTPSSKKKHKEEVELTPEEIAKRNRKAQKKDELTREHDKIINEIEQSDQTCIGTALKKYDTNNNILNTHILKKHWKHMWPKKLFSTAFTPYNLYGTNKPFIDSNKPHF